MIISFMELVDLAIMTLALGFIFKDFFIRPDAYENYDPLKPKAAKSNFWFAVMVTAPAIILHEMGHKFMAMGIGIDAVFHAYYPFLALGLILKLVGSGFIFVVPGYVTHAADISAAQSTLISFAGPGVNLLLWSVSYFALKQRWFSSRYTPFLALTSRINMFLFIFNMLPIPPFDGYSVFSGLYHLVI